jgi:hypothetical protein
VVKHDLDRSWSVHSSKDSNRDYIGGFSGAVIIEDHIISTAQHLPNGPRLYTVLLSRNTLGFFHDVDPVPVPDLDTAGIVGRLKISELSVFVALECLYPHSTPQAWQQKLNNDEVTLNGVTTTGSESVTLGQTLVWNRPPWIEPDSPQHFEVLFDDPHLLAVNKPSGLPTLPGGGFLENTLLRLVQKHTPNANPVHRLGRATTGIVLFAKTPQAASNLFANWNTPKIQKIYRALAQNVAQHDAYEILTPIGLVPHPRLGSVSHVC